MTEVEFVVFRDYSPIDLVVIKFAKSLDLAPSAGHLQNPMCGHDALFVC